MYLFLVRQDFNKPPETDAFYKIQSPVHEVSPDQILMWKDLGSTEYNETLDKDLSAISGMRLRSHADSAVWPKLICVGIDDPDITPMDIDGLLLSKFQDNTLMDFLNEHTIA